MVNDCEILPESYRELDKVDFQKNKKQAIIVNAVSIVICLSMIVPAIFLVPIFVEFGMLYIVLQFALFLAGIILYIVLHELTHGLSISLLTKIKPKYGFTGLYAYTKANVYFCKKSYIIVALSPLIIWGVVLLILNILLPVSWFWPVYLIQVLNISGAVGDFYISLRLSKLPENVLIFDEGTSMTIYTKA